MFVLMDVAESQPHALLKVLKVKGDNISGRHGKDFHL